MNQIHVLPQLDQATFKQCCTYIDSILVEFQSLMGGDYLGYVNHCKRMAGCCLILSQTRREEDLHKIAIAAAFHDIGIWTAKTMDYLAPSVAAMQGYLQLQQLQNWYNEISLMITEHHKVTTTTCTEYPLVECFRRADYADFTLAIIRFGIPLQALKDLKKSYPNSGFHMMLMRMGVRRFLQKPWSPLPMFKW